MAHSYYYNEWSYVCGSKNRTGCCGVPIALYDDVEDFVSTGLASTFLSIANSIAAGGVYTESKRSAFLTIRKKPGISLKAVTYLV
jgi:hypothetical protein